MPCQYYTFGDITNGHMGERGQFSHSTLTNFIFAFQIYDKWLVALPLFTSLGLVGTLLIKFKMFYTTHSALDISQF